ncbi:MAG: DUF4129 domain-containing protein [Oscillochloridaceae bacterium umkhey_bin13]
MRLLFTLVLLALEATVVGLPLVALTTLYAPWPLLALVVVLGWQADGLALRYPRRRSLILGASALGSALLLPLVAHGGLLPTLAAMIPGQLAFGSAYSLLVLGLFLFWRGTRLDSRDSAAIGTLFGRGAAVGGAALLIGGLLGTGAPTNSALVIGHVIALGTLGLTALALAHAQDAAEGRLNDLSWRWLITLLAAVTAVVIMATLLATLLGGGDGLAALQNLIALLIFPLALVGGIIAWFLITFLAEPISALIRTIMAALQRFQLPEEPIAQESGPLIVEGGDFLRTAQNLAEGATFLMALIPIIILVLLILVLRRRQQAADGSDEERESLGAVRSLVGDLRDLWARLRNPFARHPEGLRAALANLRGNDPTSRTRRAYVQLLLRLEAQAQTRPPTQTPAEFAPTAAQASAAEPVAILTDAYQRARYRPAGADPNDAEQAEAALRRLEG